MYVFVSLTDFEGALELNLSFRNAMTDEVLIDHHFTVESDDRLRGVEYSTRVPPLPFPAPGHYSLDLRKGHELLASHRISAFLLGDQQ